MKRIFKKASIFIMLAMILLPTSTMAAPQVLVNNGAVYVTNDHYDLMNYRGHMRIKTNHKLGNYVVSSGWIKYYIPGTNLTTGNVSAKRTATETLTANTTFKDTLVPGRAKTRFAYDFSKRYIGGATTRSTSQIKDIHINEEFELE